MKLLRGAWNVAYLDELCAWPTGSHDDQIDSRSGAFGKVVHFGAAVGGPVPYERQSRFGPGLRRGGSGRCCSGPGGCGSDIALRRPAHPLTS